MKEKINRAVKPMDGQNPPSPPWSDTDGQRREDVKIGSEVEVVLKADQKTGTLTRGIVVEILTNSSFHPYWD